MLRIEQFQFAKFLMEEKCRKYIQPSDDLKYVFGKSLSFCFYVLLTAQDKWCSVT